MVNSAGGITHPVTATTAKGESYRKRGRNNRYAWVMTQGGLSGLDDGGDWRPYPPLRRGPGAFCFRP
jgi:hypothetical protein